MALISVRARNISSPLPTTTTTSTPTILSYHAWNSVNVGPKRDIVGTWAKVARANGLRFGVSNHWLTHGTGFRWPTGTMWWGRRRCATHARLTKADGKGKWWEGLDPQELYTGRNIVIPDGITTIKAMKEWHQKNDACGTRTRRR